MKTWSKFVKKKEKTELILSKKLNYLYKEKKNNMILD